MYQVGDNVSYIYNGMKGVIVEIAGDNRYNVAWQSSDGRRILATMDAEQIELICGGSTAQVESAMAALAAV